MGDYFAEFVDEGKRLVGDLIAAYFSSYADVAADRGEAFVDIDNGLAITSHHAQRLSYDVVIPFLDELILWLATRASNVNFVSDAGPQFQSDGKSSLRDGITPCWRAGAVRGFVLPGVRRTRKEPGIFRH